jgi:hypothetical protein
VALDLSYDPGDIASCGWGIVVPKGADASILVALSPLIELRRQQAGGHRVKVLEYRSGESATDFLNRYGVGLGVVDPAKGVPYYLLIAGSPAEIPHELQSVLGLQWVVGRLPFDSPDQYAAYARSVVKSEIAQARRNGSVAVFGVEHSADAWTHEGGRSLTESIASLSNATRSRSQTKAGLTDLLLDDGWGVLVTVSHGLVPSRSSPRFRQELGAIVCGDWPGPKQRSGPVRRHEYFCGADLPANITLAGRITVHVCSYSAGTFENDADESDWEPFASELATAMLTHPNGGSLAFIGHVDRILSFSYRERTSRLCGQMYRTLVGGLLRGLRAGHLMSQNALLWSSATAQLALARDAVNVGTSGHDAEMLAGTWATRSDARSLILFGDPAVRIY